jgi:hypothetical protein
MKKRANILLILLILLFLFVVIFFLMKRADVQENLVSGEIGQENYVSTYLSSVPTGLLFAEEDFSKGAFGYADISEGIIYISALSQEAGASELIAIEKKTAKQSVRYAAEQGFVNVAGTDGSTIIFYVDEKSATTCEDLWSTSHVYYGISKGLVSYSGPAGLLIEKDAELIQDMLTACHLAESNS